MILLDFLFPKFCINCKKWGNYICDDCKKEIEFISFYICPICNESTYPEMIHKNCKGIIPIDGVMSVMKYSRVVKKVVKSIKYQLVYDIYKELSVFIKQSRIFNEFVESHENFYLQPVPLHKNRLKMRGFNQATELAKVFSKEFNYPIFDFLVRVKDTKPQAQIHSKKQRQENIKNAFIVKNSEEVNGKNIIIVDDVYTSGSTCLEAAKILMSAGASSVFIWSLARD